MRLPRWLYVLLAWTFLALGAVGVAVPVLPTTPFVLLAAWCAARGSTRLHARLLADRRFGPIIRHWEARGAVPRRAKRLAIGAMAVSAAIAWAVAPRPWMAGATSAVMAAVAVWLWRRPEPEDEA